MELNDTETVAPLGLKDTEMLCLRDPLRLGLNDTEMLGHWDPLRLGLNDTEMLCLRDPLRLGINDTEMLCLRDPLRLGLNDTERLGHNPAFSSPRPRLNLRVSRMGFVVNNVVVGKVCFP